MHRMISSSRWGSTMARLGAAATAALLLVSVVGSAAQAQATAFYYVSVKTADKDGAGTDADDVYITIHGTAGSHGPFELDNPDHDDFERGDWGTYLVTAPQNLGRIMFITLEMDSSDGWTPAVVYVLGPNIEMDAARADGKVWRTEDVVYNGTRHSQLDFYRFPPPNVDAELDSDMGIKSLTFERVNNWVNDQTIADTDKNQKVNAQLRAANNINTIPVGMWKDMSSGSQKVTQKIARGYSFEKQRSQTEIKALSTSLSASVTAGMEVSGGTNVGVASASSTVSASATVSAEARRETTNEIMSFSSSGRTASEECGTENEFDTDETISVYQWTVKSDLSGAGDVVEFSTCHIACLTDDERAKGRLAEIRPGDLKGLNCNRFRARKG